MRLWEEYQEYLRRRTAQKQAHTLVWFALTTPPAPEGAREAAASWAVKAMLKTTQENT